MFWFGLIFGVVALVAIAALYKWLDCYIDREHFAWLSANKSRKLVSQGKWVTALESQLKTTQEEVAAAEALVLEKDAELNELEEKL